MTSISREDFNRGFAEGKAKASALGSSKLAREFVESLEQLKEYNSNLSLLTTNFSDFGKHVGIVDTFLEKQPLTIMKLGKTKDTLRSVCVKLYPQGKEKLLHTVLTKYKELLSSSSTDEQSAATYFGKLKIALN